ncbi:hypothetical protein J2T18_002098 [Paenibacillus polymyxa]|nr:hypothetical protein [Paenibacillus polymyxa]
MHTIRLLACRYDGTHRHFYMFRMQLLPAMYDTLPPASSATYTRQ